jgi:hypothetical protein
MANNIPDFTYSIEGKKLKIVDLNLGAMSVTNGAEKVLDIIKSQIGELIYSLDISYCDSEGEWEPLYPQWFQGECINVQFN